jgi:hypothetical protein
MIQLAPLDAESTAQHSARERHRHVAESAALHVDRRCAHQLRADCVCEQSGVIFFHCIYSIRLHPSRVPVSNLTCRARVCLARCAFRSISGIRACLRRPKSCSFSRSSTSCSAPSTSYIFLPRRPRTRTRRSSGRRPASECIPTRQGWRDISAVRVCCIADSNPGFHFHSVCSV